MNHLCGSSDKATLRAHFPIRKTRRFAILLIDVRVGFNIYQGVDLNSICSVQKSGWERRY